MLYFSLHCVCAMCTAVQKILQCIEGQRFEMQQVIKQQQQMMVLLQQLTDGRPITAVPVVTSDFNFELPVDGECELNNLEHKLQDKQQLHSLVNVL